MRKIDVTPIEIRDYAVSYGWSLVKDAIKDGLFVLNNPQSALKQLIFPIEPSVIDYQGMAELAIRRLSEFANKSEFQVVEEIREVNDDVIALRYFSDTKMVNSLSFQETVEAIEAAKQMILAAGSSIVNPVLYHKRIARAEASELLRKTRFRHTEEGSFVLKISCPILLEAPPSNNATGLIKDVKPTSRKAFELINIASEQVLKSVEEDSLVELLDDQKKSKAPILSYNFCDSLVNFFDDERELPFELRFAWSRANILKLPALNSSSSIKFPYSFKPKIEELKNYFSPEHRDITDTFFGTVESLNGDEGDDRRRAGEVILALIIESEIINARVILNADFYDVAYKAHGPGGGLIKVKGKLYPGKRLRTLDEVTTFELVNK